TNETDAHDSYGLARLDAAAPEDVHDASQWLARKWATVQRVGQSDHGGRRRDVVLRVCVVGEQRHTITDDNVIDALAHGFDSAPPLVAGRPGAERIREPGPALPLWQVRATDTAALQPDTHFSEAGRMHLDMLEGERTRLAKPDRAAVDGAR